MRTTRSRRSTTMEVVLLMFCLQYLQVCSLQFPVSQSSYRIAGKLPKKWNVFSLKQTRTFLSGSSSADDNKDKEAPAPHRPLPSLPPQQSPTKTTKQQQQQLRRLLRELFAEALGTGLIVGWGTGAVMSAVVAGALTDLFSIAAVWTLAVTLAIATTATISGAHLNPAMTLSFCLWRNFPLCKVLPYVMAQLTGGVAASSLLYFLYANQIVAFEAAQGIVRSAVDSTAVATAKCFGEYYLAPISAVQAFAAEAVGTAVLAFCVFALTHPKNETTINKVYIPPLIGATVGALICVLAPLTQAGVRIYTENLVLRLLWTICDRVFLLDSQHTVLTDLFSTIL